MFTLLFGFRKLGTAGQKLGGAAVLCHIKHDPVDLGGSFTLTSANVGKCQTVLCRNGKPLPLSRSYTMSCEEELIRIKQHKAIITEVRSFSSESKGAAPPGGGSSGSICFQRKLLMFEIRISKSTVLQSKFLGAVCRLCRMSL